MTVYLPVESRSVVFVLIDRLSDGIVRGLGFVSVPHSTSPMTVLSTVHNFLRYTYVTMTNMPVCQGWPNAAPGVTCGPLANFWRPLTRLTMYVL